MAEEEKDERVFLSLAVTYSEEPEGEEGAGSISGSIELDEVKNDGKSQFAPGDTAWFRIFVTPPDCLVEALQSTDGSVSGPGGAQTMAIADEEITFTNSDSANTSKPIVGGVSVRWMGTPIRGAVSVTPSGALKLSQKGTGIAVVSYTTKYLPGSIRVNRITEDPYKVMVYTRASLP